MPDDKKAAVGSRKHSQSNSSKTPQPVVPTHAKGSEAKEHEPAKGEAELIREIVQRSDELDEKAEREVRDAIGESRLATPAPKIPPDLKDHGVKSPQAEANAVLENGSVIELPIGEGEYERAKSEKVEAKVNRQKEVWGVKSVIALSMLVGRLFKLAHKHTIGKLVFKKDKGDA